MMSRIGDKYGFVAPIYIAMIFGNIFFGAIDGSFPALLASILGFLVVLFVPGHVFLALWMPGVLVKSASNQGIQSYMIIIPVLSISIISFIGLILSMFGEFSRESVVFLSFATFIIGIVMTFAYRNEANLLFDGPFIFPINTDNINPFNFTKGGVTYPKAFLLVSILILSAVVVQNGDDSEEFTEIYITGLDGSIENIPTFYEDSTSSVGVLVGVNHRGNDQTFELEEAIYLIEENSSMNNMQTEFQNKRLIEILDGQSYRSNFSFEIDDDKSYYVQFNLFKNGESGVHRSTHFYIYSSGV
tara:strand:+ start:35 stop:937 length:903 start_codon:yes stop_codon:yes gene_type:complete